MRVTPSAAGLAVAVVLLGALAPIALRAQDIDPGQPEGVATPTVLILDQNRFFQESAWGKAAIAKAETAGAELTAENRKIEQALEKEERDLTERRASMEPAEFAAVSTAFDLKVEGIRRAQEAKTRAISEKLEADRQQFFSVATPVLGALLEETGAMAILADSAVVLSRTSIDATDLAIARIDIALPVPVEPVSAP